MWIRYRTDNQKIIAVTHDPIEDDGDHLHAIVEVEGDADTYEWPLGSHMRSKFENGEIVAMPGEVDTSHLDKRRVAYEKEILKDELAEAVIEHFGLGDSTKWDALVAKVSDIKQRFPKAT